GIHLTIHPRFTVERDGRGTLRAIASRRPGDKGLAESFIRIEIERQTDPEVLKRIETELAAALADVRAAVEDWKPMLAKLRDASRELAESRGSTPEMRHEACAFLDWLADDHFTLLGYREYRLRRGASADTLVVVPGTGLGILRETERVPEAARLTGAARAVARSPEPLVITKTNARSRVHRPVRLDYVSVKVFDAQGQPRAERRFLGLFTSAAYNERALNVPLLRQKAARLLEHAGVDPASHRGRTLQHIIDTLPRDDLFQASHEDLVRITNGILALQERRRVRLLARRDPFNRFYSCLVYLPRDQYNRRAREAVERILKRGLGGHAVESDAWLSESALARLSVVVHTDPRAPSAPDFDVLEREIGEAVRTWQDRLRDALLAVLPEDRALALLARFGDRFSAAYQDEMPAERAVGDLPRIVRIADGESRRELRLDGGAAPNRLEFSAFSANQPIPLHVAVRILENMGLTVLGERIYTVKLESGDVWIQIYDLETRGGAPVDAGAIAERFEECFARVIAGDVDDDSFNAFVVIAGLGWRDIALLRAYGKYLAQTGLPFSQPYVQEVLARYPEFCRALVGLFHATFDPDRKDAEKAAERDRHERALEAELERTATLDEDRILRAFVGVVRGTLRTNFFQLGSDGAPKPYISFKLDPKKLPELPEPRPMFEIYVYSQRVEGVHLRASRVARGGIRWSDRREDFRTEILGLMKAQQVKNAVIVPNGAKGGFVCKRLPDGDRDAIRAEVVECYRQFIRGLLDVTDNIVGGRVERPPRVVALDDDDPYLVVAADKGTATFSDIANALSAEYGFWLGDAFASGGSAGYDHKKMGITARGAWESVKRHFRELGLDTQTQPFTVVGIGDMSGDVFGNGMLLSEQIKLIAAFDHRHIFIDPDPDPETSYAERKRLFELPGSSWDDYDRSKLSRGGGVYSRQAKSITLSREACEALGIETPTLTAPELIRAVLKAPVDLLWNGGIGTYVKASDEPHSAAGDPVNDNVRVDAAELRCRVVGEGGNLGFTQRARIEYALRGGRINTDFIDNSGGVDSSDREVNLKILLNGAMAAGELSRARRDRLLAEMENDIVQGVLANNYAQTQALSIIGTRAAERLGEDRALIRILEAEAQLDRKLESLPSEEELDERQKAGIGLTRPEHAIVLAYTKIHLAASLVASDIPDDPYFAAELENYFPMRVRRRFKARIAEHPLRREIVSMLLAGSIANRMGPFFAFRTRDEVGATIAQVARAYAIAREIFDVRKLWRSIEGLDAQVPAAVQYETMLRIARMLRRAVYWLLQRHPDALDIEPAIARFRPGVALVAGSLPKLLVGATKHRFDEDTRELEEAGLPKPLVRGVATLSLATQILEIVRLADERGFDPRMLARLHFELGSKLGFDWLRDEIEQLAAGDRWHALARAHLRERLATEQRAVLVQILEAGGEHALADWMEAARPRVERIERILEDMRAAGSPDLAALSVALREVERLRFAYNSAP
nr:NAD-glutamate dehydrogenase [Gammaproteobacteria bacterium]